MISVYTVTENPYYELKDANCVTIGKRAGSKVAGLEEQKEFFKKCFLAEHSTIEVLELRIVDDNCRGDVINQICRATKGLPRFQVQSSRPDWNGGEKRKPSNETYVKYSSYWNPLAFMQMCRQRLCMKAQKETREWVQTVLHVMRISDDPLLIALSECCMPACQYRGCRCYELKPCGMYPAYENC